MKNFYPFALLLIVLMPFMTNAQTNIAPFATVTNSDPWNWTNINDLNFGTCGTQEAFVWTANPPSSAPGVDWMQWDFARVRSFDSLIIHHAETGSRFLTGALVQYWDGNSWVNHTTFTNLPQSNCVNRVYIGKLTTDRFRLTALEMNGVGQTSNPNFREIEIIEAPTEFNDAMVLSVDSPNVFCAGQNDVYATIANFGLNQINSVEVHWEVNGVPMPVVFYGQLLDTLLGNFPNTALVKLGTANFNAGANIIKVYTKFPNGSNDGFPDNDTTEIVVTTATAPDGLTFNNITMNSANAEVVGGSGSYEYEYGVSGFNLGNGTFASTNSGSFNISGLNPGTPYDVYIRTNCGGGDVSSYIGPFSFYTTAAVPFIQDFDNFGTNVDGIDNIEGWSNWTTLEPEWSSGTTTPTAGTGPISDHTTGSGTFMYLETTGGGVGDFDTLMSPPIYVDQSISSLTVDFWYHMHGTHMGKWELYIDTNGTHNLVDSLSGEQQVNQTDPWLKSSTVLTGYEGHYVRLIFVGIKGTGGTSDMAIDDVRLIETPTCIEPSGLAENGVGVNFADIIWKENNVATTWQIQYDTAGFTLGTGIDTLMNTDTFMTLNGLSSNTKYEFYVRSICGRGDTSLWAGPLRFTTSFSGTGNGIGGSVTTTPPLVNNNSSGGITFNVGANANLAITEIRNIFNTASVPYTIWYSTDSINGQPTISTANGWIQHQTGTATGVAGNQFSIPLNIPISMRSGDVFGFHIEANTAYQTGASGPFVFTDGILHINTGSGVGYGGPAPTPLNHIRQFLGTVVYEFLGDLASNDAGVKSIDSLMTTCPGSQDVYVTIENSGANQIDSVEVHWEVNGITQPIVHYKQLLDTIMGVFPNSTTVFLGNANFGLASNNIKVWTSLPNGVADTTNGNDTLFLSGIGTGLAGNYTIDPSSPASSSNYQTITDAVNDLNNLGICGSVNFTISAGTYNEAVVIEEIMGATGTNTITFDGVDSSLVKIVTTGQNIATIVLDGADNVILTNLSIENTGTSNAAVLFAPGSDHNEVSNSTLKVAPSTSSLSIPLVFSGSATSTSATGTNASYNLIENNRIINGYYGIRMYSSTGDPAVSNRIIGNEITGAYYYGLYTYYTDSLEVIGNSIEVISGGNVNSYGTYVYYSVNTLFNGNNIHANVYGLYMYSFGYPANSVKNRPFEISNNMIISESNVGLYTYYLEDVKMYHNTILTKGTTSALQMYASTANPSQVDLRNNILIAEAGPALNTNMPVAPMFPRMDNNIYYSTGGNLVTLDGTSYANLNALQTAFPVYNTNSIEGKPIFKAENDLHIIGTLPNNSGDNTVGVTVDIDGDPRPIGNDPTVDIGADEFELSPNDAGVFSLVSTPICAGTTSPVVSVLNYGVNTINQIEVVRVINGVTDTVFYNTPILSGNRANISLNPYTFISGVQYDVQVYTQLPNGVADTLNKNDTLVMNGMITGLSGTYTIDTSQAASPTNYQSFTDAVDDLNSYGVCGPVTFNVAAGTYNEAIVFGEIEGASSSNTITFDGTDSSLVTLVGSSSDVSTIVLDATNHLVIKNMSVENTGTENAAVLFGPGADHNEISNSVMKVAPSTSSLSIPLVFSGNITSTSSTGADASYNLIENNRIVNGYYGMRMYAAIDNPAVYNRIIGNSFDSSYYYGMYTYYTDSLEIIGNKIDALTAGNVQADGAYIYYSVNTLFNGNEIHAHDYGVYFYSYNYPTSSVMERRFEIINNMILSESDYGIYTYYLDSVNIYHNTILTKGGTSALQIYASSAIPSHVDLRNNIIVSGSNPALLTNRPVSSMFLEMDYNIYYSTGVNIVSLDGTAYSDLNALQTAFPTLNASSLQGLPLFAGPDDLHVTGPLPNNVGDNSVGVTVDIDGDPRPLGSSTTVDIGADEFDIHSKAINGISLIEPAENASRCYTAFETVVVSFSNFGSDSLDFTTDSVSITVDISGAATQTLNYVLNNNSLNNGLPLADGDTLSVPVGNFDMTNVGVYHFDVTFSLSNGPVNNNFIEDSVRGAEPGNLFGTTSLCVGDTATLFVTNYRGNVQWQVDTGSGFADIPGANGNQLKVWPTSATPYRAVTCGALFSDTMIVAPTTPAMPTALDSMLTVVCGNNGQVALIATSPNANAKFEWYTSPTGGSSVRKGGNVSNISLYGDTLYYQANPAQGVPSVDTFYVQEVVLSGSGICASSRDTAVASIDCLVDIEVNENQVSNITIQPNPSKGVFNIVGNNVEEAVEISIFNSNGKLVYQSNDNFSNNFEEQIDISNLSKGLYFVKLQGRSSMEMKKIVVQ